uniref:Uncharacterized protein n=1 Tax=Caenorhabditis japonica TaxID=281687 RepID=A0A8R1DWV8_CAEJA
MEKKKSSRVVKKKHSKPSTTSTSNDTSPDETPRRSIKKFFYALENSPNNLCIAPKPSPKHECKMCNYQPEKAGTKTFLRNVFKKTLMKIKQAERSENIQPLPYYCDTLAEYSDAPGSVDMLPLPSTLKSDDRLKNKTFKTDGTVFNMNRPWWTVPDEIPRTETISLLSLEMLYSKNRHMFTTPIKRTTFYDPLSEDLETLKAVDGVHNATNVILFNTFFSGVALAVSAQQLSRKTVESKTNTVTTKSVKFGEEPFFLHQYSRKDRLTGFRRHFVHVEYKKRNSKEASPSTKTIRRGLVFD